MSKARILCIEDDQDMIDYINLVLGNEAASGRGLVATGGGDTFFDRVRSWFRGEF